MGIIRTAIGWKWDNSYARLPETLFRRQLPTPVSHPQLALVNESLAEELGLNVEALELDGADILSGNEIDEGSDPLAQAYAGHQFGHFTMLGDGRAILLGEHIDPSGKRVDIQLKGAGRTPYSRGGDGRAALGPMLREYIISEALHGLRIPTTRSLAVVETGEEILRETMLPGAILTRVASSHLRVGTFQYAANWGGVDVLHELVDYAIERHYPSIANNDDRALALLKAVIDQQAKLIAQWQLVGFIHGVMNTDNMSISGQSIDFGPCAFMNTYNPDTVFSSIDTGGRYAYGNQPQIAGWNLSRLAEALLPVIHPESTTALEQAQAAIMEFGELYEQYWMQGMRAKLGLHHEEQGDQQLMFDLLAMMQESKADYTNTFRDLTLDDLDGASVAKHTDWDEWYSRWQKRLKAQGKDVKSAYELMRNSNPAMIPRNHIVEEVLEAAVKHGNYDKLEQFVAALQAPYAYSSEQQAYSEPPSEQLDCGYKTYCGT